MDTNDTLVNEYGRQSSPIGGRIREERLKMGLSQNEFAKKAHVHRKTQINYEQGERKPDTDYLLALTEMGCDVEYVLTGESQRVSMDAYRAILEEVFIELDLYKRFWPDLVTAFELVEADCKNRFADGRERRRSGLDAVVALLHKSPLLLKTPGELIDLIERVDFVAGVSGGLGARQKAEAVYHLFRQKRVAGVDYVDLEMVKAATGKAD